MERTIEAELTPEGALTAIVRERSFGQAAVEERRLLKNASRPEYNSQIERWITRTAVGAVISKVDPADDPQSARYSLDVEFKTPTYAQSMRGRLLVCDRFPSLLCISD